MGKVFTSKKAANNTLLNERGRPWNSFNVLTQTKLCHYMAALKREVVRVFGVGERVTTQVKCVDKEYYGADYAICATPTSKSKKGIELSIPITIEDLKEIGYKEGDVINDR